MIRGVARIARTEVLEQRRQPWMLFILTFNYVLWLSAFGLFFWLLDGVLADPASADLFHRQLEAGGVANGEAAIATMLPLAASSSMAFMFTNLPLFVAIMAGYSVLHDRTWGTLPFLMLAPISRPALLLGKLLGTMAIPLMLHLLFVGLAAALFSHFDLLTPFQAKLGHSNAWWAAYLVGGPAAGAFVGALGTVISALSKDVRTAMQFTSFFIGLLSLLFGFILVDAIPWGVTAQLAFAAACLVLGAVTLGIGSRIVSRDVG